MTRTPINRKYVSGSFQRGETGFTLMEMIMSIVLLSILGTMILQIVSTSLSTSITMSTRRESGDDAVQVLQRISREVREAKTINTADTDTLIFEKEVTSSVDTNKFVKFIRNTSTKRLRRQSATSVGGLPGDSTSGDVIAENVETFDVSQETGSVRNRVVIDLGFSGGLEWETKVYPRNN